MCLFFFFKHKTAYDMRISDGSSDVCSADLSCESSMPATMSRATHGRDTNEASRSEVEMVSASGPGCPGGPPIRPSIGLSIGQKLVGFGWTDSSIPGSPRSDARQCAGLPYGAVSRADPRLQERPMGAMPCLRTAIAPMGRSCESVSDHRETWCRRSASRPRLPLKPQASGKAPNQRRQPVAPAASVERRVVLAAEHAHAVAERLFPKVLRGQACQFGADRRNLLGVLAVEE